MAKLQGAQVATFHTARRFQVMSLSIACLAFALLVLQADDIWKPLANIGSSYSIGVLAFTAVLLLVHFIGRRFIDLRKGTAQGDSADWYKAYFIRFRLTDILCALGALITTSSSFSVYKAKVIGSQGFHYDDLFIAWDRAIFGGRDPWEITHALFPSATFTKWIDILYHPAFLPMVLGYLICIAAQARPALRYTYMLSYLASFVIIGMVMANALGSVGPVFYGPLIGDDAIFAPLTNTLAAQAEMTGPFTALRAQDYLLGLHTDGEVGFFGGISAMPSVHIVLVLLWTFAAWHIHRVLGVIVTVYAAFIWIGSVHLAWHYFVDGVVSLVVLSIIWAICGRAMGLYGRPQVIRATT